MFIKHENETCFFHCQISRRMVTEHWSAFQMRIEMGKFGLNHRWGYTRCTRSLGRLEAALLASRRLPIQVPRSLGILCTLLRTPVSNGHHCWRRVRAGLWAGKLEVNFCEEFTVWTRQRFSYKQEGLRIYLRRTRCRLNGAHRSQASYHSVGQTVECLPI